MAGGTTPDTTQTQDTTPANWRERIRQVGKEAFIREEMERLGFWPPEEGATEKALQAEERLKELYKVLQAARMELRDLDKELSLGSNIPALIQEIRRKRIERVRAAREARKQEQARQKEEKALATRAWRETTLPYLGEGVSAGLQFEGGEAAKVTAAHLPTLQSAEDVANALGITTKALAWLTYHRGATVRDHYARFTIPKRSGGTRVISAPKRQLRTAQKWVLDTLLAHVSIHDAAMAFRPGRSILDNARPHIGKGLVIRMDMKDFFPGIRFPRVKGMFQNFGYNEGVATLLALLCTEAPRVAITLDGEKRYVAVGERQLPQGACTSPAVTNILCRRMDARLTGIAKRYGFTYTRYADDMVFSHPDSQASAGQLFTRVRQIVEAEGHRLNEEKTAVMRPQHRQAVTGVVVNERAGVSRRDLRKFRAFLHRCETEGLAAMTERLGKNAALYASGYLSYLHMVNPDQAAKVQAKHPWVTRYQPKN